jgi:hypothetical protein
LSASLRCRRPVGFVIQGHTVFGSAGYSVDSAGDVNCDGFDDLIIGEPGLVGYDAGRAYVIRGHTGGLWDLG